jgi:catechol 2,3-dioxygenase-like lactoylglutathione lyase family enzyme
MKFELGSTIYFCKSVKAMITFYTTVMGLKLTGERDIPLEEWAELKGKGGFRLCLHKAGKPGSPLNNRNKLVFRVTDVAQARKYLLGQGVKMEKHSDWTYLETCDGKDPEGNRFQIACPKG